MSKEVEEKKIEVSAEALNKAIASYDRAAALDMVKQDALKTLADDEALDTYKKLVGLMDAKIVAAMAKKLDKFYPEMVDFDFSNHNIKYFVADILKDYIKKFDLSDEYTAGKVFDTAIATNCASAVSYMIKNNICKDKYADIMKCSEDVYILAEKIKLKNLDANTIVDFYANAALSDEATAKIDLLKGLGFDINAVNTKEQNAVQAVEEYIAAYKYPNTKNGSLTKLAHETGLKTLKKAVSGEKETKPLLSKDAIIIAVPIIVAIIVFSYVCIKYYGPHYSETAAEVESEAETEDVSTDDTYSDAEEESEETASLVTDTDYELAEGDTVNIDYVGSIDGVEFSGGTGNYDLTLGSGTFIDGFEDQLIGAHVGDTVDVNVTFPEDYGSEEVAGKDALFVVTINGVYQ